MKKIFLLIFLVFSFVESFSQTNLDICINLINKSILKVDTLLHEKEVNLVVISPLKLEQIKPFIINSFSNNGYKIINENKNIIVYIITDIKVDYNNVFNDNFFDESKIERKILYKGAILNYSISNLKVRDFLIEHVDTIKYNEISSLEDKSFEFLKGEIPEPPLLKSIFQPILVVGILITTVILFFNVRSK
ncbi:MAG: hypothetical protein N2249_08190 [Melioribacter sp.]|nr:hypothetical protein [Melioribacter sp.]